MTRQRVQSFFVLALAILLLAQTVQFYRFKERVEFIDQLETRNSQVLQELGKGKEYLSDFGRDLNDIRQFLLLPTREYSFGQSDVGQSESIEEEDLDAQLFSFVERLGKYEKNQERFDANQTSWQGIMEDSFWNENAILADVSGFASEEAMEYEMKDVKLEGVVLLTIDLSYDGIFSAKTYEDEFELSDDTNAQQVYEDLKSFVEADLPGMRERITKIIEMRQGLLTFFQSSGTEASLAEKHLTVSSELNQSGLYLYEVHNEDGITVLAVGVSREDGQIHFSLEAPLDTYSSTTEGVLNLETLNDDLLLLILDGADSETVVEKMVSERDASIQRVSKDRAFVAVLKEMELSWGERTETEERIYFSILNLEGEPLRIIFIDKQTGEVKVEMPNGDETQTLSMAIESLDSAKKKLWTPLFI